MIQSIGNIKEVLADEIVGEAFLLISYDRMAKHKDALGSNFATEKIKVSELKKLLAKDKPKKK